MSHGLAGLYLHVPFCSRVCPYCDFAVRTGDAARRRRYVDHLIAEIGLYADFPARFDTIYFGGGTPSLLDPADIARILEETRGRLDVAPECRIFLEANPEDVTPERLQAWTTLDIGTISLGIQAFDGSALDFLGRRHGPEQARQSIVAAREAGFATVSIDLIYGLPDQDEAAWRRELDAALALSVDHLSCYQLTIHQRTRFGLLLRRGRLAELGHDEQAELFRLTHRHLNEQGLEGYEVSQFAAAPEHRSQHNMKYWDHTPYLGLGPAAHSFAGRRRWWNVRRTDPWQELVARGQPPVDEGETLDDRALILESLMLGLRTYRGVDLGVLGQRHGVDLAAPNLELIHRLVESGHIQVESERLVPTLDGLAIADTLARRFHIP